VEGEEGDTERVWYDHNRANSYFLLGKGSSFSLPVTLKMSFGNDGVTLINDHSHNRTSAARPAVPY
jgi:hypothetical protein